MFHNNEKERPENSIVSIIRTTKFIFNSIINPLFKYLLTLYHITIKIVCIGIKNELPKNSLYFRQLLNYILKLHCRMEGSIYNLQLLLAS